jgi:hypothetical protein
MALLIRWGVKSGVRLNAKENGQISPPIIVRAARGDGSHPNLASGETSM